jgi:hypothetical protein
MTKTSAEIKTPQTMRNLRVFGKVSVAALAMQWGLHLGRHPSNLSVHQATVKGLNSSFAPSSRTGSGGTRPGAVTPPKKRRHRFPVSGVAPILSLLSRDL